MTLQTRLRTLARIMVLAVASWATVAALSRVGFPVHAAGPSFTDVRAAYGTSAGAGVMYAGDRWTVRYALTGTGGTRPWVHTLLVAASPR